MTVRRLVLMAALAAMACGAPPAATADATPIVGIGEQTPVAFTSPYFQRLWLRDARYVVAWDALRSRWQTAETDAYLHAAQRAGVRVVVTFGHSRPRRLQHRLPSVAAFRREFARFRARYPWVRTYATWNEANHCSQPTCRRPKRAAEFYNVIRAGCRGCTIVAADVLDTTLMPRWLRTFRRYANGSPRLWGLHNYIDANRFRTRGTRSLLRVAPGRIWFTETGGLVRRDNGSRIEFADSPTHAPRATRWVFRLARLSPRITRIYFYQWVPVGARATWDSALLGPDGKPRSSYGVIERWLIDNAQS